MVLAFTEEQKKEIETKGMMVIEFKHTLHNIGKGIDEAWKVLNNIANKIARAWNIFIENFLESVDSVNLVLEQIRETHNYPTSRRYKIVKIFSKCTGTDIRFNWKITFKIKRWLARSCC